MKIYQVSSSTQPLNFIEFQKDELLYEMVTTDAVVSANAASFCEISDWTLNAPRDVYNKICKWQFRENLNMEFGTSKDNFEPENISTYAKEIRDRLCLSSKEIDDSAPLDLCWTRFN